MRMSNGVAVEVNRDFADPLLRNSPLRERIDYLLDNQDLAYNVLGNYSSKGGRVLVQSNCFGTALFVIGSQERFLEKFEPLMHNLAGFYVGSIIDERASFFPSKLDGPGAIEPSFMKRFCDEDFDKVAKLNQGDLVYLAGLYGGYHLQDPAHALVYLGEVEGTEVAFHQDGQGQEFSFTALHEVIHRPYLQSNLTKFYRFNPKRGKE